jgi:chromosome segregation ATPase
VSRCPICRETMGACVCIGAETIANKYRALYQQAQGEIIQLQADLARLRGELEEARRVIDIVQNWRAKERQELEEARAENDRLLKAAVEETNKWNDLLQRVLKDKEQAEAREAGLIWTIKQIEQVLKTGLDGEHSPKDYAILAKETLNVLQAPAPDRMAKMERVVSAARRFIKADNSHDMFTRHVELEQALNELGGDGDGV